MSRKSLQTVGLLLIIFVCAGVMWQRWPQAEPESPVKVLRPRANCISFSPDGASKYVAAAFSDGRVRLWESTSQRELPVKLPSQWPLSDIAWSSDGTLLFAGGFEQHILRWNVKSRQAGKLPMFPAPVVSIAVRPKKAELLTSLSNGELWWIDLQSGQRQAVKTGHKGIVKVVRYRPAADEFVTVGADGQLVWHDADQRTISMQLAAHENEISSVAFNVDGTRLVTGSWDNRTKVWHQKNEKAIATFTHPDGVAAVAWLGEDVVTTSWDEQVRVWSLATQQVVNQRACKSESLAIAIWPGENRIAETDSAGGLSIADR